VRRLLQRAVLRTRSLPGAAALYRGGYRGAAAVAARALAAVPGVEAVVLHRGMTRDDFTPGVSDIDLLLVLEERAAAAAADLLPRLDARLRALRAALPPLGDAWAGSRAEIRSYLRWGGLRAWEDAPAWRTLRGVAPAPEPSRESPAKRGVLDPWVWAFISYMDVSRRFFAAGDDLPEKRAADARKLWADARRCADAVVLGRPPVDRVRARRDAVAASLESASVRELWLDAALRLREASGAALARVGSGTEAFRLPPPGQPAAAASLARLRAAVPAARLAVWDPPYHRYLVLRDGAQADDYLSAARAFEAQRGPGVPLVLDAASWALALQSSYLGAPLGWASGGEGRGSDGGARLFPCWTSSAAGDQPDELPSLDAGLARETAAEAASWMALWWRSLWIGSGWSNRFVLHHLYTRALGLSAALDGQPSGPFCDWELLLARAAARRPDEARSLLAARKHLLGETDAALDSDDRSRLSPAHLPAVQRLMTGLSARVASL
jgi:hypothetical protein